MRELRRMRPLLGTYVEVAACAPDDAVERALTLAFDSLQQSHELWSFHSPKSDLTALNLRPGEAVTLAPLTLRLLRAARAMTHASGGRFNCTVGGELVRRGSLPAPGPASALPTGEADDIELGKGWARLRRPLLLTLDGIAKGFAVDLAVHALRVAGATQGWVNAGGDLRVFGDRVLPVQRREADGRYAALGGLQRAAMASSQVGGADDPAFPACIVGGPSIPATAEVVTVIARSAWRADALTKVAAVVPAAERGQWVSRLGGCLVEPQREAWKEAA